MKEFIARNRSLILFVSIAAMFVIIWAASRDDELNIDGIKKIRAEYADKKIYLDVYTEYRLTCKSVIDTLGIEPITLKNKTFIPTCSVINDELVEIIYTEAISA